MKKIVSIALLFCLLFTIVGHHLVFHVRQSAVKATMKKMIRSSCNPEDQEIFVFSLGDAGLSKLEWEEKNEFRLDGKMYDVIEMKAESGKLVIRCVSDEKETALIKNYEKINNAASNNSKNKAASLIKLITTSYVASANPDLRISITSQIQKTVIITTIVSPDRSDVLTPPPQLS